MSTQGKHTAGPWRADKWALGFSVSAPDSHYTVCNLAGCNNAKANARLIASAPDLLAALQMMVVFADPSGNTPDCERLRIMGERADAAISKATGGV